jgi:hypothetical protein
MQRGDLITQGQPHPRVGGMALQREAKGRARKVHGAPRQRLRDELLPCGEEFREDREGVLEGAGDPRWVRNLKGRPSYPKPPLEGETEKLDPGPNPCCEGEP